MATAAQLRAALETQIETAATVTKASSAKRQDLDALAAGANIYQLDFDALVVDEGIRSNEILEPFGVVVRWYHRLADWNDEDAWTDSARAAVQTVLLTPDNWRTLPEVHGFFDENFPVFEDGDRVGDVLSFEVAFAVILQP